MSFSEEERTLAGVVSFFRGTFDQKQNQEKFYSKKLMSTILHFLKHNDSGKTHANYGISS